MIVSRTPLRISFAGGGTDIREHYSVHGGAVFSTAINRYVTLIVNRSFDDRLRVSYSRTEITYDVEELQHPLVRETLKYLGMTKGLEIISVADVPGGTGLGSSSAFTVGLLNALYAYRGEMKTAQQLAEEACKIEVDIVKEPIGKQDQFIAAFGGMQYISFNRDESVYADPVILTLEQRRNFLSNFLLFFVGQERSAASVLSDQKQTIADKSGPMNELSAMAARMREVLIQKEDLRELGELLHQSWLIKRDLSCKISSPALNDIYDRARKAGAAGGKILGAGGGGFFLFFVEESKRSAVRNALKDLREVPFEFEPQGSKILYVG